MKHAWFAVIVLAGAAGCKDGKATGHAEAKGSLGEWTFDEGTCYSGQRQQYFGAVAYGADGTGVGIKVVKDPVKGWSAVVNKAPSCQHEVESGGCKALILTDADCKTFDIDISNTHTTVNDIVEVEGHANLDCQTETYELHARLVFDSCH